MRTRLIAASAAIIIGGALAACGQGAGDGAGTPDPTGPPSAKADCPDCDPAGPNAFIQANVGAGFYQVGDTWLVAHRFVNRPEIEKHGDVFLGTDEVESEAFAFRYRVLALDREVFDQVVRDVVTIEITQDTPAGPGAALFSPERVDRVEHRVVFVMNDLLDPVRETVYSNDYPHGKSLELDSRASLTTGGSVFPRTVPRLLAAGGVPSAAPELPADLADIAESYDPAWGEATYVRYAFDNGDVAYWSRDRGHYWPFYVVTQGTASVLVKWN